MIEFKGQYDLSDFKKAQRLHTQIGRMSARADSYLIGLLALLTIAGVVLAVMGRVPWLFTCYLALFLGVYVLFQFVLIPRQLTRVFKQRKDLSAPFEMELTEQEFEIRNEFGVTHLPWKDFVKWKENGEMLLMYRSDTMFHLLPKRLLPKTDDIQYVLDRLQQNNVPIASKVRNPMQTTLIAIVIVTIAVVFLLQLLTR